MNLARITLYVRHDGPLEDPRVHNDDPNLDFLPAATLTLPGCAVVGPVIIEDRPRPWRSFSEAEIRAACARIEEGGGSFARLIGAALLRADATNRFKLEMEFNELIASHLPIA